MGGPGQLGVNEDEGAKPVLAVLLVRKSQGGVCLVIEDFRCIELERSGNIYIYLTVDAEMYVSTLSKC